MKRPLASAFRTVLTVAGSLVLLFGAPLSAQGGGTVVGGSGTISTSGSTTTIDQTSKKLIINWSDFSIPFGSTMIFDQPGKHSIALNRVTGNNISDIYGDLLANGQVWIINPNGVLFGKGAQINVGALIATTSDIDNRDFLKGKYNFNTPGNPGAAIVNQGTIHAADGGAVVLAGTTVSNEGVIQADMGSVTLAGAGTFSVDFQGDNLIRFAVNSPTSKPAVVSNSGTIEAAGGKVMMTARAASNVVDNVINNTGIIEATSVSKQNGEIVLDAGNGGTVNDSGTLDASGKATGQTGGTVSMTGGTVNVADGAKIDASGDAGGGSVNIGGGVHGTGSLAHAQNVNIGKATITADAITSGNGGTVALWSTGTTTFNGNISAKGGASGGNGGYVETSGHNLGTGANASVNTLAPKGTTGTWLIDPDFIYIENDESDPVNCSSSSCYIAPSTITGALATTDVTLEATDEIDVYDDVAYTSSHVFSLLSSGDINIDANIQNSGSGAINLIAGWDQSVVTPSQVSSAGGSGIAALFENHPGSFGISNLNDSNYGGDVAIGGNTDPAVGSAGGTTTVLAHDLTIDGSDGDAQLGYHGSGGGDIDGILTGDLTLTGASDNSSVYAQIGNGDATGTDDSIGNVTGNINFKVGGNSNFVPCNFEDCNNAWLGNVAGPGHIETGNVTLVTNGGFVFGSFVEADMGFVDGEYVTGAGGDVTIGFTTTTEVFLAGLEYTSPHNLTFLAAGNMNVWGDVINNGTGDITLGAGWDGATLGTAAQLIAAGAYGNNGATMTIGGEFSGCNDTCDPNVSVGTAGGTTTILTDNLTVEADNGYAQLGYHNTGGGDIYVYAKGDLTLTAEADDSSDYAMIGNGSLNGDVEGNVTGDIYLWAQGTLDFNTCTDCEETPAVWIGNVADMESNWHESGNLTVIAADEDDNCDSDNCGVDLGTMVEAALGSSDVAGSGGNVTIGFTNPNDQDSNTMNIDHAFLYDSPHDLTIMSGSSMVVSGELQNAGTGDITLIAGWNADAITPQDIFAAVKNGDSLATDFINTPDSYGQTNNDDPNHGSVEIGGSDAGCNDNDCIGDAAVGSAGGTTTILTNDLSIEADNGFAQLGYHGADGGDIYVYADGDITLTAENANSNEYAMLGNGSLTGDIEGNVTGSIYLDAQGALVFDYCGDEDCETPGTVWVGNFVDSGLGHESGNLTVIASDEEDNCQSDACDNTDEFGSMIQSALGTTSVVGSGGDVTIAFTDPNDHGDSAIDIDNAFSVDTPHNLTLISGNSLGITGGEFENAGTGDITLIAGWNSEAVTAQDIFDTVGDNASLAQLFINTANSYGQTNNDDPNHGSVLIGCESGNDDHCDGNVAVGSAGGTTTVLTNDLFIEGNQGFAQLGYVGDASGDIVVHANGDVLLEAGDCEGCYVQIGNGGLGAEGDNSGDITVDAGGTVTLLGGTGEDAYAQIGNGGANSTGDESGNIIVDAAGGFSEEADQDAGDEAYVQVGNGGYGSNGNDTGDIEVSDLVLMGGGGANAYAQIGNGDASGHNTGDVSGNIVIDSGDISLTNGTGDDSPALIGCATGEGTNTCTITGYTPPTETPPVGSDPTTIGVLATLQNPETPIWTPGTTYFGPGDTGTGATGLDTGGPKGTDPLDALSNGGDEGSSASDGVADSLGQSLDSHSKPNVTATTLSLLGGMLHQTVGDADANTPHGVPPADQDFSSWGNEAYWQ